MSRTFTFSARSSIITKTYFPPIELKQDRNYGLALISLNTFNTIRNIENKAFYCGGKRVSIPDGCYTLQDLEYFLQSVLGIDNISIKANSVTSTCELQCTEEVDFSAEDSLHNILGFSKINKLVKNMLHTSVLPVEILKVRMLRVDCNIVSDSYHEHELGHTLHIFPIKVPPSFGINENPHHTTYLPVNLSHIHTIRLKILDQDGEFVDFNGEKIIVRLELKEWV